MNVLDRMMASADAMSRYNPLKKAYIQLISAELGKRDTDNETWKRLNKIERCIVSPKCVDRFSLDVVKTYLTEGNLFYTNVPFRRYLNERLNMIDYYKATGELKESDLYSIDTAINDLVRLINAGNEELWWMLTWMEKYFIYAKKLDLFNFEQDNTAANFVAIKSQLNNFCKAEMKKASTESMEIFIESKHYDLQDLDLQLLESFLLGDVNSVYNSIISEHDLELEDSIHLSDFYHYLKEDVDYLEVVKLYESDENWIHVFPIEIVTSVRATISNIFECPDSGFLADSLADYLIAKDLYEQKIPVVSEIKDALSPLELDNSEINRKIVGLTNVLERRRKDGDSSRK